MNSILYEREERPNFNTREERLAWEDEEIRRCREGWKEMTGKHYFYWRWCKIKHASGRVSSPDYRRIDDEHFKLVESCLRGDSRGKGVICVKRRRNGASWRSAADLLHEATLFPNSDIGVQSKSDDDVKIFLNEKLKHIYSNLPDFLRAATYGNSLLKLKFGKKEKDKHGNVVTKGNGSNIVCKSPTDTNWEGMGLKYWSVDEAGKTKNIENITSMTLPCLCDEDGFSRIGFAFLYGTAGDIDTVGDGFKKMWYNSDAYDFIKFFIPGWSGLMCDEYGNEDIEGAIRWILEEREKKKGLGERKYFDFIQQYPLTPEEAFMQSSSSWVNVAKVRARIDELQKNPIKMQKGFFDMDDHGNVTFYPSSNPTDQMVSILEHPVDGVDDLYKGGADPYDHKKTKAGAGSSGSFWIRKGWYEYAEEDEWTRVLCCLVHDDGTDPNAFYEQCIMACLHYNSAKVLIEKNRAGMINAFEDWGFKNLIKSRPLKTNKLRVSTSQLFELGLYMDEDTKIAMLDAIADDVNNNIDNIYYMELLEKLLTYDPYEAKKKWDIVDAYGITLLHSNDKTARRPRVSNQKSERPLKFKFHKSGGKVVRR
jgi:hypothetical protein